MENISTKTIWHASLETQKRKGGSFASLPFSTLNEKFSLLNGETLEAGQFPEVAYLAIGIGGHGTENLGGQIVINNHEHRITDACLFQHIPFRLRRLNDDLSANERKNFRMRVLLTVNGVQYVAYYLKVLSVPDEDSKIQKEVSTDGEIITSEYTPTAQQLKPVPVTVSNTGDNESTGTSLTVSAAIVEELTTEDIKEIIDGCEIIFGSRKTAYVSEMAICSGFDVTHTSNITGSAVTYTEVKESQCMNFLMSNHALVSANSKIEFEFSTGNSIPYRI